MIGPTTVGRMREHAVQRRIAGTFPNRTSVWEVANPRRGTTSGSGGRTPAPCLLMTSLDRSCPEQIELVLIQTSLEPEEQPIIAQSRRVNRILVDQQGVHDPTHLDQLLPVATVASEARDLTRCHGTYLTQAHVSHHAFETMRATRPAGEHPRSPSITSISHQPSCWRRSSMPYWSRPLSWLCSTWKAG
jgi:hypothetical protein